MNEAKVFAIFMFCVILAFGTGLIAIVVDMALSRYPRERFKGD